MCVLFYDEKIDVPKYLLPYMILNLKFNLLCTWPSKRLTVKCQYECYAWVTLRHVRNGCKVY